jgi:F-type H+-transporting ATPase subunit a
MKVTKTVAEGATHHNPMSQFEIHKIFPLQVHGYDISYTNASLFMTISIIAIVLFMSLGMRRGALIPGRFQSMVELSYQFVADIIEDNVGHEGIQYFPLIFTIFMFVLFCNLLGLMPLMHSFTVTSHIIVTFALAAFIFIGVTLIAIVKHGPVAFLGSFLPAGTPVWMWPLMYFIELFSYLARPVSLSVRLAANMMAGHTMLKIIAGFVLLLGFLGGWMPFAFLIVLSGFEVFVAILQAYIFTVLACVYLNQALHLH